MKVERVTPARFLLPEFQIGSSDWAHISLAACLASTEVWRGVGLKGSFSQRKDGKGELPVAVVSFQFSM